MNKGQCLLTARSAVSVFGLGSGELVRALREARSGLMEIRGNLVSEDFPVRHAGIIPYRQASEHPENYFDNELGPKHLWILDQLAAELLPQLLGLERLDAIIFGFGRLKGGWDFFDGSPPFPGCELMANHFARYLSNEGVCVPGEAGIYVVDSTCTTGSLGIGIVLDKMRARRWEAAIVVMIDLANSSTLWGLNALGALSRYPGEATRASRPFSLSRSGFVKADGAAAALFETPESAGRRGAKAGARIIGWGRSSDGATLTAGRDDALAIRECIIRCLEDAALEPDQVDLIKAHGTGTPLNDTHEALAIHDAFGSRGRSVPVISFKGQFGHTTNACGLVELLLCEALYADNTIYPTVNCEDLDESLGLNVLRELRKAPELRNILFNTFGFGGVNCSYVISRGNE